MTDRFDPGTDVALYLHWPYCARICPYCDFNVVRDRGRSDQQARLVEAMRADLRTQAALLGPRRLASIFFGGGTPSLMRPEDVAGLITLAKALFPADDDVEISLEANPTDAEAGRFAALAAAGINRLSVGVQALDDAALAFLGRNHSATEARRALGVAAPLFRRLSADLIYARPGQTAAAWTEELKQLLDLGVEHVSPYQLTIEPATAFGRAVARRAWTPPVEDDAAALYETTQTVLEAAGLEAYEVSNHARGEAARSAHNVHVWRGGDYLGVGPGAHGRLTLAATRTATVARRGVADYIAGAAAGSAWAERVALSNDEADEEAILLGLRTVEGASVAALQRLGRAHDEALATLMADGFLIERGGRLIATPRGRPVLDAVIKALLV